MTDQTPTPAAAGDQAPEEQAPVRTQRLFDAKTQTIVEFPVKSIKGRYRKQRMTNRELLDKHLKPEQRRLAGETAQNTQATPATPLKELGLPPAVRNTLLSHGVQTVEELVYRAETGPLTDFDGIDAGAEKAIRLALAGETPQGCEEKPGPKSKSSKS